VLRVDCCCIAKVCGFDGGRGEVVLLLVFIVAVVVVVGVVSSAIVAVQRSQG